jgi:transcriptional regulator with XRE-family HTH domain
LEDFRVDLMRLVIEADLTGVGDLVRRAREGLRLSQAAAGQLAGMSGANLSRIESEDAKGVPLATLLKVLDVVDLDPVKTIGDWILHIPGVEIPGHPKA